MQIVGRCLEVRTAISEMVCILVRRGQINPRLKAVVWYIQAARFKVEVIGHLNGRMVFMAVDWCKVFAQLGFCSLVEFSVTNIATSCAWEENPKMISDLRKI